MDNQVSDFPVNTMGTPELVAAQQLEEAAHFLDLERWILQGLHQCDREIQLNLQIKREGGEPFMFRATRVQHRCDREICFGPLLISPETSAPVLRARAMSLSWQWALWNLPFSGSAGGIQLNPDAFTESEMRMTVRQYVHALSGIIGPDRDVLMADHDCPEQFVAWTLPESDVQGLEWFAGSTGKPLALFGVEGSRIEARFLRALLSCVFREQGIALSGANIVLSGFNARAQELAAMLESSGAHIIAVSDMSGATFDCTGLNIGLLRDHVRREGVLFGYAEAQSITREEMIGLPCDALILHQREQVERKSAARSIFEAGGTVAPTVMGDAQVIPQPVADFGSSLAAFAEWRKNMRADYAQADCVRGLEAYVGKTWAQLRNYADSHEMPLASAAITLGLSRIAARMRMS
jgi:glutamate dehydrogenase (NAD(P)+)